MHVYEFNVLFDCRAPSFYLNYKNSVARDVYNDILLTMHKYLHNRAVPTELPMGSESFTRCICVCVSVCMLRHEYPGSI